VRSFDHDRHVAPGPLRLLVLSNLYPPAVRGGYEVECHGVVEHLRRAHDVTVVTSTEGDGDEPHVRRVLPWSEDTRAGVLRAPLASLLATRVVARVLDDVRPELIWVWNGAGVPYVALRDLHRSGIPVAYRVCEHWFGGIYAEDLLLRFVLGDGAGHGAWAHVARAANHLPPVGNPVGLGRAGAQRLRRGRARARPGGRGACRRHPRDAPRRGARAAVRGGLCARVASQRPIREVGATYWVYTWVNAAGGLGHSGPGYRRSRSWCAGVKNPR
jgi:hypothetical protein